MNSLTLLEQHRLDKQKAGKMSATKLAARREANKRIADYHVWVSKLECKRAIVAAGRKAQKKLQ